jgi:hypothetical protein
MSQQLFYSTYGFVHHSEGNIDSSSGPSISAFAMPMCFIEQHLDDANITDRDCWIFLWHL